MSRFYKKFFSFLTSTALAASALSSSYAQNVVVVQPNLPDAVADDFAESPESVQIQAKGPVPLLLEGIWENYNRYVVFDTGYLSADGNSAVPQIVLRTFYQWYDDRAAESPDYTAKNPKGANNTTAASSAAERITLEFVPLIDQVFTEEYGISVTQDDGDVLMAENLPSGAWDMLVTFSGRKLGGLKTYHVPIAVIGNNLYLDFCIHQEDSDYIVPEPGIAGTVQDSGNQLTGYWKDSGNASGILVSPPVINTELLCYYISGENIYPLRYWQTDMDYDKDALATFDDEGRTVSVPKHLWVGDRNFTCATGRRRQIRNLKKTNTLGKEYTLNSVLVTKTARGQDGKPYQYTVRTATLCAFGKPYLTLTDGTRTIEEIIAQNNARRHPPVKPLFPVHGILDFDWSIVQDPPESYDRRMLDLGK